MQSPEAAAATIKSAVKRVVIGDRHHGGVNFSDVSSRGYDRLPDLVRRACGGGCKYVQQERDHLQLSY